MPKQLKRMIILIVGATFMVLGVLGLALPFLQGIFFLAIGAILLSITIPAFRSWVDRHTVRYPKIHALFVKLRDRIERIIGD